MTENDFRKELNKGAPTKPTKIQLEENSKNDKDNRSYQ